MHRDNIKLVRRTSGGGAVYHDLGNCNYAVIAPTLNFHRDTYATLIANALNTLSIPATINTRHDVIVDDKKIITLIVNLTSTCLGLLINSQGHIVLHTELCSLIQILLDWGGI